MSAAQIQFFLMAEEIRRGSNTDHCRLLCWDVRSLFFADRYVLYVLWYMVCGVVQMTSVVGASEQSLLDDYDRLNRLEKWNEVENVCTQLIALRPNGLDLSIVNSNTNPLQSSNGRTVVRWTDAYYRFRSDARIAQNKLELALADLVSAWRVLDTDDVSREVYILSEKIRILEKLNRFEEALWDAESLSRIYPKSLSAYTSIASLSSKLNQPFVEIEARTEMLKLKPNDWKTYSHRYVSCVMCHVSCVMCHALSPFCVVPSGRGLTLM